MAPTTHRPFGWACLLLFVAASAAATELIAPLSDGTRLELPEPVEEVPAPQDELGYALGTRFTHWSEVVDYLEKLSDASPRVSLREYGRSWEGRPLLLLAISSAENIERLDRLPPVRHRLSTGAPPLEDDPVVVWLGCGAHGNEPASTEAAMAVVYLLATADGEWAERLERMVVLVEPLANPDGRERYVHFYESRRGRAPDPLAEAAEHWEPWPGGRHNHYLVDLNRDWAWATQIETRNRLVEYARWEPQVHVDLHEESGDSTATDELGVTPAEAGGADRAASWVGRFDRANAAAFGRHGWLYRAAGVQDLSYPGYGDSYPTLRGAVGMTYEIAGHGRAGEALRLPGGGLLTLADRIARHLTASLVTLETAAAAREELLADFTAARRQARSEPGPSYLWDPRQPEALAAAELLALHGAMVRRLEGARTLLARPLSGGPARPRSFAAGTWVVSSKQPLGELIRALMELDSPLPESFVQRQRELLARGERPEFTEVTNWSIPLAYNLEAWATNVSVQAPLTEPRAGGLSGQGRLGYLMAPQGLAGFRFNAGLVSAGVQFRVALEAISTDGRPYPAGTIFVPTVGNSDRPGGLEATLAPLVDRYGVSVERTAGVTSAQGTPLAPDRLLPVRPPRVALVGGEGVDPTSYGALWHLLDRDLELPHHRVETRRLAQVDLSRFDLLILPSGYAYDERLDREAAQALGRWVQQGGLLVAVGGAVAWLRHNDLTDVEAWRPGSGGPGDYRPAARRLHTPGAALATRLSTAHPLVVGMGRPPTELFIGREILLASGEPSRDVLLAGHDPLLAGFAWPQAVERLAGALLVGVQPRGRGALVLFAQEPAFRLFWRAKLPLFFNAVVLGPSLSEAGLLSDR